MCIRGPSQIGRYIKLPLLKLRLKVRQLNSKISICLHLIVEPFIYDATIGPPNCPLIRTTPPLRDPSDLTMHGANCGSGPLIYDAQTGLPNHPLCRTTPPLRDLKQRNRGREGSKAAINQANQSKSSKAINAMKG